MPPPPSPLRRVDQSCTVGGRAGIGILRRYIRNEEIRGLHVRGHRSQRRRHRRAVRWPGVIHEAAEACRGDVRGRKGERGVVVCFSRVLVKLVVVENVRPSSFAANPMVRMHDIGMITEAHDPRRSRSPEIDWFAHANRCAGARSVCLTVCGAVLFFFLGNRGQTLLTEEEVDAVNAASLVYDATQADQELTESGTIGEVSASRFATASLAAFL